jgi:hypothetical protein
LIEGEDAAAEDLRGRLSHYPEAISMRGKRVPPALKHGAYSEAALLPGEDPDEFKALHKGLIAEFTPNGRMEEETVLSIARLTWRRRNLARFEAGQFSHWAFEHLERAAAKESHNRSKQEKEVIAEFEKLIETSERIREAKRDPKDPAAVELFEASRVAVLNRLMKELDVEERLDAMIDKLIKRLLFVRGLKSITPAATALPSSAPKALPAGPR